METLFRRNLSALLLATLALVWGATLAVADRIKIEAVPPSEWIDSYYLHQVHTVECATQYPSIDWALGTLKDFGWRLASEEQAALHLHSSARFRAAFAQVGRARNAEAALATIDGVGALASYPPQGSRVLFVVDDEEPAISLKMSLALQKVGDGFAVDQICELLVTDKEFVERFRSTLDVGSVWGLASADSAMIQFRRQGTLSTDALPLFPKLDLRIQLLDWQHIFGDEPKAGDAYAMSFSRHSRPDGQ